MRFNTQKLYALCTTAAAATAAYASYYYLSEPSNNHEVEHALCVPPPSPYLNLTLNFNTFYTDKCLPEFHLNLPSNDNVFSNENWNTHDWGLIFLNTFKEPVLTLGKEASNAIYKYWFKSIADGVTQIGAYGFSALGLIRLKICR